jgi:hypothetical protein
LGLEQTPFPHQNRPASAPRFEARGDGAVLGFGLFAPVPAPVCSRHANWSKTTRGTGKEAGTTYLVARRAVETVNSYLK